MRRTRNLYGLVALAMLLVVFVVAGTPASATDITYSGQTIVISQPGTYVLKNDITNSNNVICIEIKASNVVFDGGGHLIDGDDGANKAGIYVHNEGTILEGVTVKNVRMQDWYYGIYFNGVKNSRVQQSTIQSNSFGGIVMYRSATGNTVSGNKVIDNAYGVIFSDGASNGVISNNEIRNNERGLYIYLSDGFTVTGNQVTNNINNGIQLHTSGSGTIYNNNLNNNLNVFFFGEPFRANAWSVSPRVGPNVMNGPSIGGNFWGTPSGTGHSQVTPDTNADGFADEPLTIAEGNVDNLPLVQWTGPTLTPTPTPTGTVNVTPTTTATPGVQTPYKTHTLPTRIEAEDYDLGGEGVAYHDVEPANLGKAYRLAEGVDIEKTSVGHNIGYIRAGEWTEYTVNVPAAGTYTATFRVAGWTTGRQVAVSVDGAGVATVNIPNTGAYTKWQNVPVSMTLEAGTHVIRLGFNGDKQNLDYFEFSASTQPTVQPTATITSQPGQTPYNGPHVLPGRVQAEDFDNGGQNVAYFDSTPQNKGGAGRVNEAVDVESNNGVTNIAWITNNEWTEYTVEVGASGAYTANFRVGAWSDGKKISVSVDGQAAATVNVPNTGSYVAFETVPVQLSLAAGTHVIRLTYLGDGQNIDWFEVVSGAPTTGPTTEPNATPTIEPSVTTTITPSTTATISGQAPYRDHAVPGRVQAEDYDMGGPGVAYSDSTPENKGMAYRLSEAVDVEPMQGGGYNIGYITNGEWVEYTLTVPQAGTYQAGFRVGSWFSGNRQIKVSVGGVEKATVTVPVTGKDYLFETVTVPMSLDAGTQVVRLTFVGEKQNIDYFEFCSGPVPSVTPTVEPSATMTAEPTATTTVEPTTTATIEPTQTPTSPGECSIPGRVEAENYDDGPAGVSYRDLTPGNQGDYAARNPTDVDLETLGSGANVAYIRTGEWLIYTLNVGETNTYDARFRVASWVPEGTTPGQRSIMVRVDDQPEKTVNVPLTGGTAVYDTVSTPLYLTAGEHEIGLRFVGWYQNFDWMEFAPAN